MKKLRERVWNGSIEDGEAIIRWAGLRQPSGIPGVKWGSDKTFLMVSTKNGAEWLVAKPGDKIGFFVDESKPNKNVPQVEDVERLQSIVEM